MPLMRRLRRARATAPDGRWQRQLRASRRWAFWGVALGALAGTVLAAPAQWLAQGLADATGGRLLLAQAEGSLWNGSAVLVLTGGSGSRDASALPGRLHWTLRPGWGGLQLQAQQACCLNQPLTLRLAPGWAGYTLALLPVAPTGDAARASPAGAVPAPLGQWPAGWLAGLGAPFNTLGLGGTLRAASPGFTLQSVAGRLQLAGALQLELQDASSRVSPLPVLGSYRLLLQGQAQGGDTATVQLQTTDGALLLNGTGQWTGGRLRFRGAAQAAPGQDAVLANLLNIIGRRQGAVSVISIG